MFLPSYDAIPTNNSTSHINSNSNLIANHYNQNDNETEIRQYSFSIKTLAVFGLVFSLSLCVTTLSTYYAVKRNPFPQKITCTPQLSSAFSSRTSSLALTECLNDCDKPCSTYQVITTGVILLFYTHADLSSPKMVHCTVHGIMIALII
jgi:hypothetical protein